MVDNSDATLTRDEIALLRRIIRKLKILAGERDHAGKKSTGNEPDNKAVDITVYCSFCGRSQHEVEQLIAGPSVYICDACVSLCVELRKYNS